MPYPMDMDTWEAYRRYLGELDLATGTRHLYWRQALAFRGWLGDADPRPEAAASFLADLRGRGYQAATIGNYYAAFRVLFGFLGLPLKLRLRRPRRLPPYWDTGDIERLLAQAERGLPGQSPEVRRRNTAALLTLTFAGLRRGELLGLRVADLDFRRRTIRVTGKGDRERVIPMAARLVGPLWEQARGLKAGDRVFPLGERHFYSIVVRLARAAGLEGFHPHSCRHAFATRLLERGANVRQVQELLGHQNLETTAVYLGVSNTHLKAAIGLLDGDSNAKATPEPLQPGGRPAG